MRPAVKIGRVIEGPIANRPCGPIFDPSSERPPAAAAPLRKTRGN